jgi:hypothetical protein
VDSRNYLAAVDSATGVVDAWNPNPNEWTRWLAAAGGKVYAAGTFTSIVSWTPRNNAAAVDLFTGQVTAGIHHRET